MSKIMAVGPAVSAVSVRRACKSYPRNKVIDNLDLTVKSGTIYGLLGASGCGKTTILSCIVGVNELDSGDVSVFGYRPGCKRSKIPGPGVGYMPQDIALHNYFTVSEILSYYGMIFGIHNSKERGEELLKFLQLSKLSSKRISNLSGGQQRRVSLSIALLQKAPLLILDEPTVGLDPVLRQSIWQHLLELVAQNGSTILLTTHYIEEARCSDTVGILRKGRILAEDNPDTLIANYGKNTLESVVLHLCHHQDFEKSSLETENDESDDLFSLGDADEFACKIIRHRRLSNMSQISDKAQSIKDPTPDADNCPKFQSTWYMVIAALAWKNVLMNIRFKTFFACQMLIPVILVLVMENTIGMKPIGLGLGVVSETPFDGSFCPLNNTLSKECLDLSGNQFICRYLNALEKQEFWLSSFSNKEAALESVQLGRTIGYIEIPLNFSATIKNRLFYGKFAQREFLSELGIRLDRSNFINVNYVIKALYETFLKLMTQEAQKCGNYSDISSRAEVPIKWDALYGNFDGQGIRQQVEPFILTMLMFILTSAPMLIFVLEKVQGQADRDAVAGVRVVHSIPSSILSCSIPAILQISIFFSMFICLYGMKIHGSWILALSSVLLTCLSGMSFGFMTATLTTSGIEFSLTQVGLIGIFIFSSGLIFPLNLIPRFYRIFCYLLPVTLTVSSLSEIILKGGDFLHPKVYPGFISSIVWIVFCVLVSALCRTRYAAKK